MCDSSHADIYCINITLSVYGHSSCVKFISGQRLKNRTWTFTHTKKSYFPNVKIVYLKC